MTNGITNEQIETGLRHSRRLRAEAFGSMVRAIGRGLRASARILVAMFS